MSAYAQIIVQVVAQLGDVNRILWSDTSTVIQCWCLHLKDFEILVFFVYCILVTLCATLRLNTSLQALTAS